jgi:hypothetical protein
MISAEPKEKEFWDGSIESHFISFPGVVCPVDYRGVLLLARTRTDVERDDVKNTEI